MRAAFLLSRVELRHRWASLVVLAVLVALTGGVTLTAVAGARRTSSSFDRFLNASRSQDLIVFADDARPADVAKLRRMPGVEAIGYARGLLIVRASDAAGGRYLAAGGAVDDSEFHDVDRLRIVEGRAVAPGAANEVVIDEPLARAGRLSVGQTLDIDSYTPGQAAKLVRDEEVGKPRGPRIALRVVGISRSPSDLSLQGSVGGVLLLSRDFVSKYGRAIGNYSGLHSAVLSVRLRDHAAGVPEFLRQARRVLRNRHFDVDPAALSNGGVQDSIDLLAISVLALGVITAASGLIALGLTISRETSLIASRQAPVRDLGLSRPARAVSIGAPVLLAVILGAAVATLLAWVASPLLPFGVARQAEPDPGMHFDGLVLGLGTALLVVVVGAIVAFVAWRAARTLADIPRADRPSLLTRVLEGVGLAPTAGIGVRMALEPRSGRASVPVRSSLIGAGVAVLGLVAVSVFAASLQHLHDTPAAFGRPWDVRVVDTRAVPQRHGHICGGASTRLQYDPDVAAIASGCTVDIELNGRAIGAFGMTPVLGSITPTVLRGRAPTRSDEIALGTQTSSALGVRIGDRVTGRTRSGAVEYRVVGQVAVPALSDPQAVADGAVLAGAGLDRLTSPKTNFGTPDLLVRFRPGVDKAAAAARIRRMPGIGGFEEPGVTAVNAPLEVERIDQIHRMPLVLGAFLALVGAIAVAHLLVTSVRRRRHDFAVLKAIGFTSRQVFAAVSWQATTVAVAGLLVGLGLGLAGGALMWRAVAHQVGVLPTVEIPVPFLVAVAAATIAGVNAVAAIPARAAARTRPAVTLRSE